MAVADAPAPLNPCVCDPTIEGTCMRRPAFTSRARTVPVIPWVTGHASLVVLRVQVPLLKAAVPSWKRALAFLGCAADLGGVLTIEMLSRFGRVQGKCHSNRPIIRRAFRN